jgi:hypothetical protein
MSNYVPFLKFKTNEIAALSVLEEDLKVVLTPFFDAPRKTNMTEAQAVGMVDTIRKKTLKHLSSFPEYYIDDFDIDDGVMVDGHVFYEYLMSELADFPVIPIVALDREENRVNTVFQMKSSGTISSDIVAIRLQREDFESYALVESDFNELLEQCKADFERVDLILDTRVSSEGQGAEKAEEVVQFLNTLHQHYPDEFRRVVVAGSSIPARINQLLGTEEDKVLNREELFIYDHVIDSSNRQGICFGDYGIVSPYYSDVVIPAGALRNITAPKIVYSFDGHFYIRRGGALSTHADGATQYNLMCADLITMAFYRGRHNSFGDTYIYEKANNHALGVTPSSILKPLINAHITYMMTIY